MTTSAFATRLFTFTLVALLLLHGQLVRARLQTEVAARGEDGDDNGWGNGDDMDHHDGGDKDCTHRPDHPDWHPDHRPDDHHERTQVLWGQCGGYYYNGTTRCPQGSYCRYFSDWYAQCNPDDN